MLPITNIMINLNTIKSGKNQFNGKKLQNFDRYGIPTINIFMNAPGIPLSINIFFNIVDNTKIKKNKVYDSNIY